MNRCEFPGMVSRSPLLIKPAPAPLSSISKICRDFFHRVPARESLPFPSYCSLSIPPPEACGNVKQMEVPFPGPSDSTQTLPPWQVMIRSTRERPIPVPPDCPSSFSNSLNIFELYWGSIPIPWSWTQKTVSPLSSRFPIRILG